MALLLFYVFFTVSKIPSEMFMPEMLHLLQLQLKIFFNFPPLSSQFVQLFPDWDIWVYDNQNPLWSSQHVKIPHFINPFVPVLQAFSCMPICWLQIRCESIIILQTDILVVTRVYLDWFKAVNVSPAVSCSSGLVSHVDCFHVRLVWWVITSYHDRRLVSKNFKWPSWSVTN